MLINQWLHPCYMRWTLVWRVTVSIGGLVLPFAGADPAWASDRVPEPLADVVVEALEDWTEFAAGGYSEILDGSFAVGSPQRRQLEAEAIAGLSNSAPTRFAVRELRLRGMGSEAATVWIRTEASRPGFEPQTLDWDFDLVRRDGRWLVWSVVEAEPPEPTAISTGPITATSTTTTTTSPAPPTSVVDAPVAASESGASAESGVKLPVLSAWVVVVTLVGVVAAGYLAPRLERRERS